MLVQTKALGSEYAASSIQRLRQIGDTREHKPVSKFSGLSGNLLQDMAFETSYWVKSSLLSKSGRPGFFVLIIGVCSTMILFSQLIFSEDVSKKAIPHTISVDHESRERTGISNDKIDIEIDLGLGTAQKNSNNKDDSSTPRFREFNDPSPANSDWEVESSNKAPKATIPDGALSGWNDSDE